MRPTEGQALRVRGPRHWICMTHLDMPKPGPTMGCINPLPNLRNALAPVPKEFITPRVRETPFYRPRRDAPLPRHSECGRATGNAWSLENRSRCSKFSASSPWGRGSRRTSIRTARASVSAWRRDGRLSGSPCECDPGPDSCPCRCASIRRGAARGRHGSGLL